MSILPEMGAARKGGEKRQKGPKKVFEEIIAENIPNMRKKTIT